MTDKQIIIDGVDVADCEHINACDKKMKCVILQDDVCETNPYCEGFNCYYKQLKRKEQECEELKRQRQSDKGLITSTGKQNYQLIQEYDKLKNCLTEIKEIAEKINDECEYNCFASCAKQAKKQILQKISECEGNDEIYSK